jgi:uncharacterized repeat protein (TIGR03803 family)
MYYGSDELLEPKKVTGRLEDLLEDSPGESNMVAPSGGNTDMTSDVSFWALIRTGTRPVAAMGMMLIALVWTTMATGNAHAQTYAVLHAFTVGTDGQYPYDGLVMDAKGNLYGTTFQGGGVNSSGTIFKVNKAGKETILYSFGGVSDGAYPVGGLLRDSKANLYGTTSAGGGTNSYGTIFQLTGRLHEVVLYSFNNSANGLVPFAGLVADIAGNLYGTTYTGGSSSLGTVYKLRRKSLKEVVLHNFNGGTDGEFPWYGPLVRDSAGNMYGTTVYGGNGACGNGCGVVFKLDIHFVETILYNFGGGSDGENPFGGVIRDAAGNLYGTTHLGGAFGGGTVYKLDTTGKETILYSFAGGADGVEPYAGLIRDTRGNLYGTTQYGGTFNGGTMFKVDTTGKETVLHSFNPSTEGAYPTAPLALDAKGNLYGTTLYGGPSNDGVVFKLKP